MKGITRIRLTFWVLYLAWIVATFMFLGVTGPENLKYADGTHILILILFLFTNAISFIGAFELTKLKFKELEEEEK